MIFGIFFLVVGYAVFYWGIHHFLITDPNKNWPRWSLMCLLNLGGFNFPTIAPIQFDVPSSVPPDVGTGPTNGMPGHTPSNTNPGPNQITGSAPTNWQRDILSGLNAPVSQNNIAKLTAWNACEGNAPNQSGLPINNPFNITCVGGKYASPGCLPGATPLTTNIAGVLWFDTWAHGVSGTVNFLGSYPLIAQNLENDGSSQDFINALRAASNAWGSDWSCAAKYLGYIGG